MKQREKPPKNLVGRVYATIHEVGDQGALTREVIAEVLGLNKTDLAGVDFLCSRDGICTAGELSRATGLTSGSTTALIDRLKKAGYAVREDDPTDRRRRLVRLSDKGHARCEAVYEPIRKDMFKLWSNYSARVGTHRTVPHRRHPASRRRARAAAGHPVRSLRRESAVFAQGTKTHVKAARAIEPLCMLWCITGFLGNEWTHAFKLLRRAD